jgi:LuxR family maltose regulon positive regulatory protein
VLQVLATAASNKGIAARLSINESTVEGYLTTIYRKLGVKGRVQAIIKAMELGLIALPECEKQAA